MRHPAVMLALAVGALCATVLTAIVAVAGVLWLDLDAAERAGAAVLLEARLIPAIALLLIAATCVALIFTPLIRSRLAGPARLAERTRILLAANRAYRVPEAESAELAALARLVNQLADQRDALQSDVERRIRESLALLEEEKNRLAALVSELAQGIVACNLDGRILLYNNRARLLVAALARGDAGGNALIGLGRSVFGLIERPLIEHALDNIRLRLANGGQRASATFVTASRGGPLFRVQMAPVLAATGEAGAAAQPGALPTLAGYVLLLENITRSFEAESRRDQALHALTEGSRATLANIRAAVETLAAYPDMEAAQRERFIAVVAEEVRSSSARLDDIAAQHADALRTRWVLEEMRGADLVTAARAALQTRLGVVVQAEPIAPGLWVKADSFTLIHALARLAERLHKRYGVGGWALRLTQAERLAQLDLVWSGTATPLPTLQAWQQEPLGSGLESGLLSLHDVAERHGGETWFAHDGDAAVSYCRVLLPIAQPQRETPQRHDAAAGEYDFALLEPASQAHALDERALTELSYTAFDTETTGLRPAQGDQIIQIGAVRIVNLRLLGSETFDQLVDPRRRLDPASGAVHGIGEDMLRGQPTIDEVLPAFHAFCADTVLVGHNAAFDMRFLQLKEAATGVRFDQPLLDTLLLSEVVHPAQGSHRLEAIAERLGIRIEARHNALGDAMVTAQIWLRMIGLLTDAGIRTLGQARAAAAKTYYARVQY